MPASRARLSFDGAADPNPGAMGAGALLVLPDGSRIEIAESFAYKGSNNVAEYYGLILGLEHAARHGVRHIDIRGDSQLVVNQAKGEWKVNQPHLRPLVTRAQHLARGFADARIEWVRRENNEEADILSKRGLLASKQRGALRSFAQWKEEAIAGALPHPQR